MILKCHQISTSKYFHKVSLHFILTPYIYSMYKYSVDYNTLRVIFLLHHEKNVYFIK